MIDCIILAGGFGTRLQSVVADKPKCLAEINGKPFLYYLCKKINDAGFQKVIFSVGYKKEMVIEYINANKHEFSFEVDFAEEETPLGTGGAILFSLLKSTAKTFFVLNGDTFFDIDIKEIVEFHQQQKADCTLVLKPMEIADRYGLVNINNEKKIIGFEEKKVGASGLINGGVYCVDRKSFMDLPFEKTFSFEKDFLEKYLNNKKIVGITQNHYFIDIGIPEDYEKAQFDFRTIFKS